MEPTSSTQSMAPCRQCFLAWLSKCQQALKTALTLYSRGQDIATSAPPRPPLTGLKPPLIGLQAAHCHLHKDRMRGEQQVSCISAREGELGKRTGDPLSHMNPRTLLLCTVGAAKSSLSYWSAHIPGRSARGALNQSSLGPSSGHIANRAKMHQVIQASIQRSLLSSHRRTHTRWQTYTL